MASSKLALSKFFNNNQVVRAWVPSQGGTLPCATIDSEASYHMTGDQGLLEQGTRDLPVSDIMTADGTVLSSRFKGTVHITAPDGTNIRLLNVLFIPGLAHNLISVKAAMEAGADVGPHRPYAIEGPFEPLSTWTEDFLGSKLVCKGT